MNYNEFFNDLAANSSRNYKIAELEKHRNDTLLQSIVRLALDPFTQFYIRKIPEYTPTGKSSLEWGIDGLYELSHRVVTGNAAIEWLTRILTDLSVDDAKVIERIIQKDLRCGVSVSTVNSVWTNIVHEYPVMLCSPFEQKLVDKIAYPALAQKKEDGMRFNAIVRDGKVEFRSRNGKQIELLGELEQEFITLADGMDVVFDGELLVMDEFGYQFLDRQTGNGILNKANKSTIKLEDAQRVHAQLWDMIPYMYFADGEYNKPYVDRWTPLQSKELPKRIHLVETQLVYSLSEAQIIFENYLANGFEGIILKDGSGIWQNKRSKNQIKFKGEYDCDLKVVDWLEGTGKNVGKLGALVLESADGLLKTNVGTGFSDEQRGSIKVDIVGKIAAIKYNGKIVDKRTGVNSLFLPVFIEIREDKDVADTNGDIK